MLQLDPFLGLGRIPGGRALRPVAILRRRCLSAATPTQRKRRRQHVLAGLWFIDERAAPEPLPCIAARDRGQAQHLLHATQRRLVGRVSAGPKKVARRADRPFKFPLQTVGRRA